MKLALKIIIVLILIIPAITITAIIWILGGWTQSPYMNPNPVGELIGWLLE